MKTHNKPLWWTYLALGLVMLPRAASAAPPAKIRLFILSGQSNMAGLNPDVSFTPALKKAFPNDEVIVVKHALGGQPIRRWYKAWKAPQGAVPATKAKQQPGDLYDALMTRVKPAIQGKAVDSVVFVWMQGERDAKEGLSAVYAEALRGLIKQLRDDLKRSDVAVVIGRLSDHQEGEKHWDAVRATQEKVASEDPQAAWVDTDDLNGPKNDLHYTKEGYEELGRRFAAKAVKLAEAPEKREQETVAATQAAIEKLRKADAKIRIVDAGGRPLPGVRVSVEQISHEFLFGCNIYMFDRFKDDAQNVAYKKRFEEVFNYATVGFYWRGYEPQRGKPNYEYTDKVVAWCRDHGIRMKGHPLLWGEQAGIPLWSHGQPSPEIQRQRVQDIIGRYQGKIASWEVVNEPSHLAEPKIDQPYRWARQADPRAYLIVNDYHVLADGCPSFFKLLTAAKQDHVPFDGIGIQAHEPRTMRFPLDRVQETLDHYALLGKELHITEFTPTSGGKKVTGWHRDGVWDEVAQADYAVKFYRVCFAHPAVRAITWWDLCDQGSWLPGGGLLRADMSPKPVYEQLKRLIQQQWKTAHAATTDADGRISFRGFCGTYRLLTDVQGRKLERQFQVTRDPREEVVITVAP